MKTEDLVLRLVASAEPVQPLPPPSRRWCAWALSALAITMLTVALIGIRPDAQDVIFDDGLLAMAVATLATAFGAAAAALVLSVPGADTAGRRWTPIVAAALWGVLLLTSLVSGGLAFERLAAFPVHLLCVVEILALALIPGWMLFVMIRSAAPLRHRWSSGLAVLAAAALAAAGTQFLCPIDDSAHHLVGHFAPVGGVALAGTWVGQYLLRKAPFSPL